MKLWKFVVAVIALTLLVAGGWDVAKNVAPSPSQNAGSFSPTGGGTYFLVSSVGTNDTTLRVTSPTGFSEPVSDIPYTMSYLGSTIEFGTISPQTDHSEFISFTGITQNTDGSATLTGVVRGLSRTPGSGGCIASSTLAQPHSGQEIFILSNSPCFYSNYITNTSGNSNTIYSSNEFASTTYQGFDLDPGAAYFTSAASSTFIDQAQLNRLSLINCVNATASVDGCVQLATARQAASSTVTGSTGANLAIPASIATDTPQNCSAPATGGCVVMSLLNGKLSQLWLDLTQAFTFTGLVTFNTGGWIDNASSTATAAFNIACTSGNKMSWNGVAYACPSSQGGSNTFLKNDGSGNLSWGNFPSKVLTMGTTPVSTTATATTTLASYTLPANTLTSGTEFLQFNAVWQSFANGQCADSIAIANGTATTTIAYSMQLSVGGSVNSATMYATTTTSEITSSNSFYSDIAPYVSFPFSTPTQTNGVVGSSYNLATNLSIIFNTVSVSGTGSCSLESYSIQLLSE